MYLTPYIQDHLISNQAIANGLKLELDRRLYHYGEHFNGHTEVTGKNDQGRLALVAREWILALKLLTNKNNSIAPSTIVTNCYVSIRQNLMSQKNNFIRPPWDLSLKQESKISFSDYSKFKKVKNILATAKFNQLFEKQNLKSYDDIYQSLTEFYSNANIVAGLFPNDVSFFEILSLEILKKLNKKSFLLLHGIPGIYNKNLYNKSDYLLVWGTALKKHFIQQGFDADKIIVVGHPFLSGQHDTTKKLKNELGSVLVLGSAVPGGQYDRDEVLLWDRGNIALHCYQIQKVLMKLGVKKARLRPHPSENKMWYKNFINMNFFEFDNSPDIVSAVKSSTLIIGPTSSSFLESLYYDVNYIVYEPFYNDDSALTYKRVPPFDGSDNRLLIATNENELEQIILSKKLCDLSLLTDYLGEKFCLDETINELLNK